tara:strand:- start:463 stop:732 length:270 start_codon:yes stop_codon:yes gene_type:complete
MADTIYLGSGKSVAGEYGEFFSITVNLNKVKENPQVVEEYMKTKYIRLNVTKKKEKDKFGKDVSVTWAQYKKDTEQSVNSKDEKEDFPF